MTQHIKHSVFLVVLAVVGWFAVPSLVHAATLSLSPSTQNVMVGGTFTVNIFLDTTGQSIYGVDIYSLRFDTTALSVVDADGATAGVQITPGTLMPITQSNFVNTTAGTIQFSQIPSTTGTNYTGSGVLASVTFTALKTGTTNVTFDFTPGSTIDTNVAALYNDVLTAVTNGSYTIGAANDTTAPTTPVTLTASTTSASAVSLSWTASTDPTVAGQVTSGVSGYQIFRCTTPANCTPSTQVATSTSLTYSDTGLSVNTAYRYRVRAYDAAGNVSGFTSVASATTASGPDTTAPSVPGGVAVAAVSTTQLQVSWTASTDPTVAGQVTSGVSGYRVYRNGSATPLATVNAPNISYQDMGLTPGTSYSYTVAAFDSAGNVSSQSSSVSGSTQSNPDSTAPIVSLTSPGAGTTLSGSVTVAASASDPTVSGSITSGLALVSVYLDGNLFATSTSGTASKNLDTTTLTNALHTFVAVARDGAGNQATATPVTVTVFNLSTATRFPRKFTLTSIEGLSTISSYPSVTASVVSPSNQSVLGTQTLSPSGANDYTVTFQTTDPQSVSIRVKVSGYLTRLLTNIDTTQNTSAIISVAQLLAGDFNNDNTINSLDFSTLNTSWNQSSAVADITKDGIVNTIDYAILKNNWAMTGE